MLDCMSNSMKPAWNSMFLYFTTALPYSRIRLLLMAYCTESSAVAVMGASSCELPYDSSRWITVSVTGIDVSPSLVAGACSVSAARGAERETLSGICPRAVYNPIAVSSTTSRPARVACPILPFIMGCNHVVSHRDR